MIDVLEYVAADGRSPFRRWFRSLGTRAAARVTIALTRLEQGLLTNLKSVGGGVQELRIHHGPGYRIYLGRDGEAVIILLAGGTKKRQQTDIEIAKRRWADYRRRKMKEDR